MTPKITGYDDVTGEALMKRLDDDPNVYQWHLQKYTVLTLLLLEYYKKRVFVVGPRRNERRNLAKTRGRNSRAIWIAAETAAAAEPAAMLPPPSKAKPASIAVPPQTLPASPRLPSPPCSAGRPRRHSARRCPCRHSPSTRLFPNAHLYLP
ncbi:Adenylate kinase [Neolecta irregularis DAH-3]|uniref:Adenylate kinase n=1 Tax=Neolecta irregularis (strain DAH-3) TaxID=1198029 RepID=A0A1U7LJH9_NEOID|nr:Adenylate kinase [Neolecta irregularis DAH-3]|eukprot:OLL22799.1 Adenylate kinase [Neolecta irregularis DAH-3]